MMLETLESRTFLSAQPFSTGVAKQAKATPSRARHAISQQRFVIGFYGLGGQGWDNSWLATTADTAGKNTGSTVLKYQEDDGTSAESDFFASVDQNGDHVLSAAEIDATTVRVVGYSFGGVQAAN